MLAVRSRDHGALLIDDTIPDVLWLLQRSSETICFCWLDKCDVGPVVLTLYICMTQYSNSPCVHMRQLNSQWHETIVQLGYDLQSGGKRSDLRHLGMKCNEG
jgi:hypothetical protein